MNLHNMKLESVYAKGEDGEFHLVARRDECETKATAEKEYIEREAAKKKHCEVCMEEHICYRSKSTCDELKAFDLIPAADVRPVVLCRDCQNSYEWANVDGDNYRYCGYLRSKWNRDIDRMVDDDDFCKWGVKREES